MDITKEQKDKLAIVQKYAKSKDMGECMLVVLKGLQEIATPDNKAAAMIWVNIEKEVMNLNKPIHRTAWDILDSLVAGIELLERKG